MGVALILPAGGSGTRFGGDTPKQFVPLVGIPVIRRSLDAFCGFVDLAIVPVAPALREQVAAMLHGSRIPVHMVASGDTRMASVANGMRAVPAEHAQILIHDAVRPCVPASCIRACIAALGSHDAAVVALPCPDTVKRVERNVPHRIATTVPRDDLWLAQTPQGLRREAALAAFAQAQAEGWLCSDDVQVIERWGGSVVVVRGDRANLKITTPDDWAVAEALIQRRQR